MPLKIQIDAAKIAEQFKEFALEVEQDIRKSMGGLAALTEAKVRMEAAQQLKTSRGLYLDNLTWEEVSPGIYVVALGEPALWIEEGIEPNTDMKPGLLKDAKTSKRGTRYKVIPFKYSNPPSQNTPYTQGIISEIKQKLRKEKVPFKKIELNADGSPKIGKLHEFNFGNPGGRMGGPGKGNTPVMKGLSIYQSMKNGNVRRDILTFRTVSSGPGSQGKWIHPGAKAKKFMDAAADWAMAEWENKILPEIMLKWGK